MSNATEEPHQESSGQVIREDGDVRQKKEDSQAIDTFPHQVWSEASSVVLATRAQISRIVEYLKHLWSGYELRQKLKRVQIALGEQMCRAGVGDEEVRQKIATMDELVKTLKSKNQSATSVQQEEEELKMRLANQAIDSASLPEDFKAYQRARKARLAVDEHKKNLQQSRSRLFPDSPLERRRAIVGAASGTLAIVCLIVAVWWLVTPGTPPRDSLTRKSVAAIPASGKTATTPITPVAVEQIIANDMQRLANVQKQKIFQSIHPIGTAKSIVVHDVTITAWKGGNATSRFEDILQYTVRYSLYWEGPVTKDGFTKVSQTYDAETQRFVSFQILATNGITNENVAELGMELIVAGLLANEQSR